ncbi:hypothetical protein RM844_30555 [Streptomyces sp. DSM 44915]|uniref:Uncharacterized protein n=1 Tax=Streptomyces chisholmiae TaxID=3075540 RepID=A0ABU2K2E0_9ACTN|nr:hypothetical protein [Streptomyces sp. DSM 44915]MDT0270623.1 hypothetical protein [Streptomyces sp. DSM 44915]
MTNEPTRTTIPTDPDRVRELRDALPVDRVEIRHLLDEHDAAFAALATAGRSWAVAA